MYPVDAEHDRELQQWHLNVDAIVYDFDAASATIISIKYKLLSIQHFHYFNFSTEKVAQLVALHIKINIATKAVMLKHRNSLLSDLCYPTHA